MHHSTTRRGFVTGASALALSVALPTVGTAQSPTLAAELRAILDRPVPGMVETYPPCDCPDCTALRALPFECDACGYDGPAMVFSCECDRHRRLNIADLERRLASWMKLSARERRQLLRQGSRARAKAAPFKDTRRRMYVSVMVDTQTPAELRADIRALRADLGKLCPCGPDAHCAHGATDCPACGHHRGFTPWNEEEDQRHNVTQLRDLRALLTARGLL